MFITKVLVCMVLLASIFGYFFNVFIMLTHLIICCFFNFFFGLHINFALFIILFLFFFYLFVYLFYFKSFVPYGVLNHDFYIKNFFQKKIKIYVHNHGFHIIKKRTVCAMMVAMFIGLFPFIVFKFFSLNVNKNNIFSYLNLNSKNSNCYVCFSELELDSFLGSLNESSSLFLDLFNSNFLFRSQCFWVYFLALFYFFWLWVYCIINESESGSHTFRVQQGLLGGFILFLASEVMFFFSIFFAFFYFFLNSGTVLINAWPAYGLLIWKIFNIPALNSFILILSGCSVTCAHQALILQKKCISECWLLITIVLGVEFTCFQFIEYIYLPFEISTSSFGSIFFFATGFHGFHVFLGSFFLFLCYIELRKNRIFKNQYVGLECAIWYWHFVDVVWLFLYIFFYIGCSEF